MKGGKEEGGRLWLDSCAVNNPTLSPPPPPPPPPPSPPPRSLFILFYSQETKAHVRQRAAALGLRNYFQFPQTRRHAPNTSSLSLYQSLVVVVVEEEEVLLTAYNK